MKILKTLFVAGIFFISVWIIATNVMLICYWNSTLKLMRKTENTHKILCRIPRHMFQVLPEEYALIVQ